MEALLTIEEVAGLLGMAPKTLYNRRSRGASMPPCIKLGKLVRYRPVDVETWVMHHHIEPPTDKQPRRHGRPTKAEQVRRRQLLAQGARV